MSKCNHCACVPGLMKRVNELEAVVDRLQVVVRLGDEWYDAESELRALQLAHPKDQIDFRANEVRAGMGYQRYKRHYELRDKMEAPNVEAETVAKIKGDHSD